MFDTPVDHEAIERGFVDLNRQVIAKLPDCVESREAKRLVEVVEGLAHQAREKVKPS